MPHVSTPALVSLLTFFAVFGPVGSGTVLAQAPFEAVVEQLRSPDPELRLHALALLRGARYPEAAAPVSELAADPEDRVQLEAIATTMDLLLEEPVTARRRAASLMRLRSRPAGGAAFAAGSGAMLRGPVPAEVPLALRAAAGDASPVVASEALYAFATLASGVDGARRPALQWSSEDVLGGLAAGAPSAAVRLAAVRAVGRLYARRPIDAPTGDAVGLPLVAALDDVDPDVRLSAIEALGAVRYTGAVRALSERSGGHGGAASAALDALARIGDRSSASLFADRLGHRDPAVRRSAVEGLARAGAHERAEAIVEALGRERDDSVLLAGSFAALQLSGGRLDPIVEALVRPSLRAQALGYLVEIADRHASLFVPHSRDPEERIRLDVAAALAASPDPAAGEILERMAADTDPEVARAARRALAQVRSAAEGRRAR
jgi:HEAT repeat protein